MEIEIVKDEKQWDSYVFNHSKAEFLQSWEWGEFKSDVGNDVIRLRLLDKKEVRAQVQGFVHNMGFGLKYLYLPRIMNYESKIMESFFQYLQKNGFMFLRMDPAENIVTNHSPFTIHHQKTLQPQNTLILNIQASEETLLANMHSKTRYNIKLSERKGVKIKQEKNIDIFWELNKETTNRDGFKSHDKKYYEKMLGSNIIHQFTAYMDDAPIASNICVGFRDTFTYLHGTSGNCHRSLMAPYLLQSKQIEYAKENNFTKYDFWGIAPKNEGKLQTIFHDLSWDLDNKWTGITRFKAGFGGERKNYPNGLEIVLNPTKYKLYKLAKKIRKN